MLAFLFVPLSIGWLAADSWSMVMTLGVLLGTAGASFAVALPLASAWYPAHRQGSLASANIFFLLPKDDKYVP
jgi:NNP family nitrate/nitrite transporter-like MFS transporter